MPPGCQYVKKYQFCNTIQLLLAEKKNNETILENIIPSKRKLYIFFKNTNKTVETEI